MRLLFPLLLLLAGTAQAQAPVPAPAPAPAQVQPQAAAPNRADAARRAELDRLFEALRTAPDEAGGALVESRIRALWGQGASPAVVLLLRRGLRNLEARVPEEAVEDFDAAVTLAPEFAEAWLLRARAQSLLGDAPAAARDLQEALRLEPRHFGALIALSMLQEERGDLTGALRSFEAALAIHPKLPGAEQRRRELRRRALGDDA